MSLSRWRSVPLRPTSRLLLVALASAGSLDCSAVGGPSQPAEGKDRTSLALTHISEAAESPVQDIRQRLGLADAGLEAPKTVAARPSTRRRPRTPPPATEPPAADAESIVATPLATRRSSLVLNEPPSVTAMTPAAEPDEAVYSVADADVEPPALISAPLVSRWRAGETADPVVLEFLIAKDGSVCRRYPGLVHKTQLERELKALL